MVVNLLTTESKHFYMSLLPEYPYLPGLYKRIYCYFQGYKIDWKKGKNVTVKQVKKKLRKTKNRLNVSRYLVKTTEKDSFFHFFDPPECKVPCFVS